MPLILVAADAAGAGASTVAAGLARRIARTGRPVRLERLAGAADDERAAADAAAFAALDFARASGEPLDPAAPGLAAGDGDAVVAEAPPGEGAPALAASLGARLVAVARAGGGAPAPSGAPANGRVSLLTRAPAAAPFALPEDRLLAAPTVATLIAASGAEVLARSVDGDAAICEHLVIGAIAPDFADGYFARFPRAAIVTRSEKVDVALAALRIDPECLILSGGGEPSPYLLDRVASARRTTLLLAPGGTVETVRGIEGCFGRSPFAGEAKAERAGELMAAAIDDAALAALLPDAG